MIVEDKSKGEYFMNSGMIDYNSVIMIIKKIELYRDNEEKIISVEDQWLIENNLDEGNEWPYLILSEE